MIQKYYYVMKRHQLLTLRQQKLFLELIRDINKKLQLTVVVITHEMQVIKDLCDKVAVLDHGVIAENGTVLEIFTNPKEPITKEFYERNLVSNELPAAYRNGKVHKEYIKRCNYVTSLDFYWRVCR
mgnify:CR=1 FL=1